MSPARVSMSAASRFSRRSRRSGPSAVWSRAFALVVGHQGVEVTGVGRAATPAAAAHWNRIGSSAAGRPIELIVQVVGGERRRARRGRRPSRRRGAPRCRTASSVGVQVGLGVPAERGHRHGDPAAGADASGWSRCGARCPGGGRARRRRTPGGTRSGRRRARRSRRAPCPTSMPVKPRAVPVPTIPGPIATIATSAPATCRAIISAENTLTASWSPPNVWPQVIVVSTRPRSRRVATRSLSASGSAAPSVMTYAMRASGRTDRMPTATAGSWLCSGVATTGSPVGVGVGADRRVEVLLGRADVGLEARVAQLHDVARAGLDPLAAREVPVHEVPAAGAEPEVDRGGVHDDASRAHGPVSWSARRRSRTVDLDVDLLQPALVGARRRHRSERGIGRSGVASASMTGGRLLPDLAAVMACPTFAARRPDDARPLASSRVSPDPRSSRQRPPVRHTREHGVAPVPTAAAPTAATGQASRAVARPTPVESPRRGSVSRALRPACGSSSDHGRSVDSPSSGVCREVVARLVGRP